MIQVNADHDIAVAQDDAADVAMDDHLAGPVAAELMDVRGARRSGAAEDWDRLEAEIATMDAEVGDDPVGLYMREIGRVELLTVAEERALTAEIELANHLEELDRWLRQWPATWNLKMFPRWKEYGRTRSSGEPSTG